MEPIVFLEVSDEEWARAEEEQKASGSYFDEPDVPGRDPETQSRSGSSRQVETAEASSAKDRKGKGKSVNLELSTELPNTNTVSAAETFVNYLHGIRDNKDYPYEWPGSALGNSDIACQNRVKVGWKESLSERQMQHTESRLAGIIERLKREHEEDHPMILVYMRELAYTCGRRRVFKESEKLFRKIVELSTRRHGAEYPYTVNALFDLGLALISQGRIQEGRKEWERFIEIGKRILAESASTSTALGVSTSGEQDGMLACVELRVRKAEWLLQMVSTIQPEDLEGRVVSFDGDTEADFIQLEDEESFKDLEIGFGELATTARFSHYVKVSGIKAQVSAYSQEGRPRRAVQYLLFMLDVHEKVIGSEAADTLAIRSILASLYETNGQWKEAEGQYARLAELKRKTLGERDPETMVVEIMHARMIAKQGHEREEDAQRVGCDISRKALRVLESLSELFPALDEFQVAMKGSWPKKTSGVKPKGYSKLVSIVKNRAEQQTAAATDANEPPLNVTQPVSGTSQRDPGGTENSSETKGLEDLEEAIRNTELAMEVAPAEAPPDLASITNLSRWYMLKFERTGDAEDLGRAYMWAEQAMDLTPEDDQEFEKRQSYLGVILSLYLRTEEVTTLENSVEFPQQAEEV